MMNLKKSTHFSGLLQVNDTIIDERFGIELMALVYEDKTRFNEYGFELFFAFRRTNDKYEAGCESNEITYDWNKNQIEGCGATETDETLFGFSMGEIYDYYGVPHLNND